MTNGYSTPIGVPIGLPSILSLGLPPLINPFPTLNLDFIENPQFDSRITFSRGSQATLFDSTGTLRYAANNTVRNNMMVGAVAGSPGTLPTNWIASVGGLAYSVVGTGVENGITYIDLRFQGTPTSTGPQTLTPDIFSAFVGQTFTASGYFKLAAGTTTNINTSNFQLRIADEAAFTLVPLTSTLTRISNTRTLTGTNAGWRIRWNYVDTVTPVDFTLRIGMPQLEIGSTMGAVIATSGTAYYAPRFDYNPSTLQPRGLLIEEQRTNSIRNNTAQGAVAGTPGTTPTNWGISTTNAELTSSIIGTGTESGITYIDIRINGTVTAARDLDVRFEVITATSAASGQAWTQSVYLRQVGGSQTNISAIYLQANTYTAAGAYITTPWLTAQTATTAALTTQRSSAGATLSGATTAYIASFLKITTAASGAVDFTLRIGLPQLELGAFATSVIPTTTTALTRNADVASMTGTNFSSWYSASEGTFVFNGVTNAATGGFLTADNGSVANYMRFSRGFNKANFLISNTSGTQADLFSVADITLGTQFKLAGTYKVNDAALSLNGAAAVTDTLVTLPDAADRLRIGFGLYTTYLNGHIQRIAYYPTRLSNAQLQALTL